MPAFVFAKAPVRYPQMDEEMWLVISGPGKAGSLGIC